MRDPKRIPIVLDVLRRRWEQSPDLRLCQLIVNLTRHADPFYVEDEELMRRAADQLGTNTVHATPSTINYPAASGIVGTLVDDELKEGGQGE